MEIEEIIDHSQSFEEFKQNTVQDILTKCEVEEINQSVQSHLPGNICELTKNLLLCSASSVNPMILDALNINCVVNVAPELPDTPLHSDDVIYYKINVLDNESCRILSHFDEAANLINKIANSGGRTLVYCVAGVSRSPSICLAYLMKYHQLTLLEAYNYVKLRRSKIKPNCEFFKQLIQYEEILFGCCSVRMVFNEFVQMEIPEVYDCDYRFARQFRKKRRNQNGRY